MPTVRNVYFLPLTLVCWLSTDACRPGQERQLLQQIRLLQQENNALKQVALTAHSVPFHDTSSNPRRTSRQAFIQSLNEVKTEVIDARQVRLVNPTALSFAYVKAQVNYYAASGQVYKSQTVTFDQVGPRSERATNLPADQQAVSYFAKIVGYQSPDLPGNLQLPQ